MLCHERGLGDGYYFRGYKFFYLLMATMSFTYIIITIITIAIRQTLSAPTCTDFNIPVTVIPPPPTTSFETGSANFNILIESLISTTTTNLGILLENLGSLLSTTNHGPTTYSISMRYCEPEVFNSSRASTIHYLQHAITMTKDYWNGLAYPVGYNGDRYSYIAYMSKLGYPTLSVDNLGTGNSSHPDPVYTVQMPLQAEIINEIISMLRSGEIPEPVLEGRKFDKIIYVGHSYGSILGNSLATRHPNSITTLILTGYSTLFDLGAVPLSLTLPIPSFLVQPPLFSRLASQPLYLAMSSPSGRSNALFTPPSSPSPPQFDPALASYSYSHESTVALGEIATLLSGLGPAPAFTGAVLVITGEMDAVVCYNPLLGAGDCRGGSDDGEGESIPEQARVNFPKAAEYKVLMPAGTGHAPFLHFSAQEQFEFVGTWLKGLGY
ncbi:hypothetical protein ACMFMF_005101 [Clarireedia jacksonii]